MKLDPYPQMRDTAPTLLREIRQGMQTLLDLAGNQQTVRVPTSYFLVWKQQLTKAARLIVEEEDFP